MKKLLVSAVFDSWYLVTFGLEAFWVRGGAWCLATGIAGAFPWARRPKFTFADIDRTLGPSGLAKREKAPGPMVVGEVAWATPEVPVGFKGKFPKKFVDAIFYYLSPRKAGS